MLLIMFFIIVLNIVAIALTYYCLSEMESKEKLIFIAAGVTIIYLLTSFVYWISTKNVSVKAVSDMGKNLITLLFVPINGIVILPILAKSYTKYRIGMLGTDNFKNRALILGMILAILLIIECVYFKDIQNNVVVMIEKNQKQQMEKEKGMPSISGNILHVEANQDSNTILNEERNNTITNEMENGLQANEILNETENKVANELTTNEISNNVKID